MAQSGIKLSEQVTKALQDIGKKQGHRYVFFGFNQDGTEVLITDEKKMCDTTDEDFDFVTCIRSRLELELHKGCYVAFYMKLFSRTEVKTFKPCLICWAPNQAKVRDRMLVASTWETMKKAFNMNNNCMEAHDLDELEESEVAEKLGGKLLACNQQIKG